MDEKLIIDIARLNPDGEMISGEVDAVDLDEEFVKPFGGIRYELEVKLYGRELLVKGNAEQDFDLVCSRCGKDFDDTVKVPDYMASFEVSDDIVEVDLTESLRECIILNLPTYPVCDEACPGIEQTAVMPDDDRWGALDQLKVQGDKKNGKS
jgi:uncharacterized metal-binding protein YceD (DUF177 family)